MLAATRAFAKSWVAAVLIGLLIVSFAVFGITDVFQGQMSDSVVKAGKRSVTSSDFKREFDAVKARAEQQAGQPLTTEQAAEAGLDRRVVDGIASREAFLWLLSKAGIHPGDALIAQEIQKIPAFFDSVSGRFDKTTYQQRLAQNELTPAKFEAAIRDQITQDQFSTSLIHGLQTPRAYSALAAIFALENRDIAVFPVSPATVQEPALPTDAQLEAFAKENAAQLTRPEQRVVTVVRFSPNLVDRNLTVDPAEVQKRYDFRKDTLSTPELRSLVQIPAKNAVVAQQIMAALAQGQAPAAAAKSAGVDAITYDQKPQSAIPDHKVAAAAFKMAAGQSAAVVGDLGQAVVKVLTVTPGRVVSLAEARPQIEAEVRKDALAQKVYALTQAYDDAHQAGANLAEAAQKAGVPAVTIGPVTAQGRDIEGREVNGLSRKMVETAFSLPNGGESELVDAGNGDYFAVRVERVTPSAVPPVAEIKPQLTRIWMIREMGRRMQAKADELAARVTKGESLEAVAASIGVKVSAATAIDRRTATQNPQISEDLANKLFGAKVGETFVARTNQFGFLVGKLTAIHAGDTQMLGRMTEGARQQMTMTYFRELQETTEAAARSKVKVRVDYNRARTALGLEPLPAPGKAESKK